MSQKSLLKMKSGFERASLKISNAMRHLSHLRRVIDEYSARQEKYVKVHYDSHGMRNFVLTHAPEDIPPDVEPVIGDILHNCRSSLDHIMWEMIKIAGGQPDRHTQFPVFSSGGEFDNFKRDKRRQWQLLPQRMQAIIEREQPFYGRSEKGCHD